MIYAIPPLGIYLKEMKALEKISAPPVFTVALWTTHRHGNKLNVH